MIKTIVQRKDDDVQLFCNYIGNVLRSLPPLQKAEAKRHLSSVVSDYEILAARIATGTERSDTLSSSYYITSSEGSGSSTNVSPGPTDTHHLSVLGQSPVQHITGPYSPITDVQSPGHVSSPEPTDLPTTNQDTNDSLQDFFNLCNVTASATYREPAEANTGMHLTSGSDPTPLWEFPCSQPAQATSLPHSPILTCHVTSQAIAES